MEDHIEEMEINSKRDKGFTLVELLIVIVILGILATVTVFAVRGITDKGKTSACQADQKTLETAVEAWYALPQTVDILGTPTDKGAQPTEANLVIVKLIRSQSSNYDVNGATGDLVAVAASGCPAVP